MGRIKEHLRLFGTAAEHDATYTRDSSDYYEPWVSYTVETETVDFNLRHDYSRDYLTFIALGDGEISFSGGNELIEFSMDGGVTWDYGQEPIAVSNGGRVLLRGRINEPIAGGGIGTFATSMPFNVEGNPLSLLHRDNFVGVTEMTGLNFIRLFEGSNVIDASNMALPVTTLPVLCYNNMFSGCTSLTAAPALPATTLSQHCYSAMFYGCTSLTAAPELPASQLTDDCYEDMFNGCTNLRYIKAMFLTEPSDAYTKDWVRGVSPAGEFVKDGAAAWNVTGTNGIPEGWTVRTA